MNDKIDIELVEDEDVARVKAWWRDNGTSIIAGVAIGTAVVVGYNYWTSHKEQKAIAASELYQQAISENGDATLVEQLSANNKDSAYAALAQLKLAKDQIDGKDFVAAIRTLESALADSKEPAMQQFIRLRLAIAKLAAGDNEGALTLVRSSDLANDESLTARLKEIEGDALANTGDAEAAALAYQAALDAPPFAGQSRQFLQLKLDNL